MNGPCRNQGPAWGLATPRVAGKDSRLRFESRVLASPRELRQRESATGQPEGAQTLWKPQTPLHLRLARGLPALEWACGDVGRCRNALKVSDHNQQEREKASTHMLGHEQFCLAPRSGAGGGDAQLDRREQGEPGAELARAARSPSPSPA